MGICWRCWRRECRASLKTNDFDLNEVRNDVVVRDLREQQHEPDDEVIHNQVFINDIKSQIEDDLTAPVKRIYNRQVAQVHCQGDGDRPLPEFHLIQSQLHRAKQRAVPPILRNVDDVNIDGEWANTWQGFRNLVHLDNDWGIAVFATDANIETLENCRHVYIDGTFRTVPNPYRQFLTVHGECNDQVLLCVSVLMVERNIASYRQVFQILKRIVLQVT